jgi:hypothetical protein
MDTFINRTSMYPYQLDDGSYVSIHKPLTVSLIERHLVDGLPTLGAYALDAESMAKWICFDADEDQAWCQLQNMASALTRSTLTPYLEPSRRGGHLWLFTPRIAGFTARRIAQQLAQEHGVNGVEIFPKQDELKRGPGSFVRLPLGVHKKANRRYHFVGLDGDALAPSIREQIALLASPECVPQTFIDQVLDRIPDALPNQNIRQKKSPQRPLPDTSLPLSERVKQAISVDDYIRRYMALDDKGKGFCPFHQDEHQSFQVNIEAGYWNCYAGCGGGSIIDFAMKWREKHGEEYSFSATLHDLAKMLL